MGISRIPLSGLNTLNWVPALLAEQPKPYLISPEVQQYPLPLAGEGRKQQATTCRASGLIKKLIVPYLPSSPAHMQPQMHIVVQIAQHEVPVLRIAQMGYRLFIAG